MNFAAHWFQNFGLLALVTGYIVGTGYLLGEGGYKTVLGALLALLLFTTEITVLTTDFHLISWLF